MTCGDPRCLGGRERRIRKGEEAAFISERVHIRDYALELLLEFLDVREVSSEGAVLLEGVVSRCYKLR